MKIERTLVEKAAKAAHEAERASCIASGDEAPPTWDEAVADPTLWGGPNFLLREVLDFQEAALRVVFDELGLKEERRQNAADGPPSWHMRLVSDWRPVEQGDAK